MSLTLKLSLSVGVIIYFILIIFILRKKALTLKYAILWIVSGFIMLFALIFPGFLGWLSALLGIETPSNAVFALTLFFVLVLLMSISSIVSKLNEKVRQLIQHDALLEKRIRDLEERKNEQ
jgi:hypothetical protein